MRTIAAFFKMKWKKSHQDCDHKVKELKRTQEQLDKAKLKFESIRSGLSNAVKMLEVYRDIISKLEKKLSAADAALNQASKDRIEMSEEMKTVRESLLSKSTDLDDALRRKGDSEKAMDELEKKLKDKVRSSEFEAHIHQSSLVQANRKLVHLMKCFNGTSPYAEWLADPSSSETRLSEFSILETLDHLARGHAEDFEACWAGLVEQSQQENSGTIMEMPEHRLLVDVHGVLLLWSRGERESVKVFRKQDIEYVFWGADTQVVLHSRSWMGVAPLTLVSWDKDDEVILRWVMTELVSVEARFEYT